MWFTKTCLPLQSTNKHTNFLTKMQPIINVRKQITQTPIGESVKFERWQTTSRYVRTVCSDLRNERGWIYKVAAPKDSEFIEVTRYE